MRFCDAVTARRFIVERDYEDGWEVHGRLFSLGPRTYDELIVDTGLPRERVRSAIRNLRHAGLVERRGVKRIGHRFHYLWRLT